MSDLTRFLLFALIAAIFIGFAPQLQAGSIDLRWDAVPGASGYRVWYGTADGQYDSVVDVGNVIEASVQGLVDCTTYHVAVQAYNWNGESPVSQEVSGWAHPELSAFIPARATQGSQFVLEIPGANFRQGVALDSLLRSVDGNPLARVDLLTYHSCHLIEAVVSLEPMARGVRAMAIGFSSLLRARNPDGVAGTGPATLEVQFDISRVDINRADPRSVDRVDGSDLAWLAFAHGAAEGEPRYNPDADLTGDGLVDGEDLAFLATFFGRCWSGNGWVIGAC